MKSLLLKIEQKRYDMLITARKYGLKSEKTIQLSQELDELLNTYNNALEGIDSNFIHVHNNAI